MATPTWRPVGGGRRAEVQRARGRGQGAEEYMVSHASNSYMPRVICNSLFVPSCPYPYHTSLLSFYSIKNICKATKEQCHNLGRESLPGRSQVATVTCKEEEGRGVGWGGFRGGGSLTCNGSHLTSMETQAWNNTSNNV